MKNYSPNSILPILIKRQPKGKIKLPTKNSKVGFLFSTKDRADFSVRSLRTMDTEKGFDIVWIDGSDTEKGKELPDNYKFRCARLKEAHLNIRGGPEKAAKFGLERLLDLGYDYCGSLENDNLFKPGWFRLLLNTFKYASGEGISAGAATVRNYNSRVLEFRKRYTINWNMGAGMVLFTRKAAEIILDNYPKGRWSLISRKLTRFYGENFGIDISANEEWKGLFKGHIIKEARFSPDWGFAMHLYENGLSSVGSIPNFVKDIGSDVKNQLHTRYVSKKDSGRGLTFPPISKSSLIRLSLSEPLLHTSLKSFEKTGILEWRRKRVLKNVKNSTSPGLKLG